MFLAFKKKFLVQEEIHKGAKVPFFLFGAVKSTARLFSRCFTCLIGTFCNQNPYLKWQCWCIRHRFSAPTSSKRWTQAGERKAWNGLSSAPLKAGYVACSNSSIIFFLTFRRPRKKRLQTRHWETLSHSGSQYGFSHHSFASDFWSLKPKGSTVQFKVL